MFLVIISVWNSGKKKRGQALVNARNIKSLLILATTRGQHLDLLGAILASIIHSTCIQVYQFPSLLVLNILKVCLINWSETLLNFQILELIYFKHIKRTTKAWIFVHGGKRASASRTNTSQVFLVSRKRQGWLCHPVFG